MDFDEISEVVAVLRDSPLAELEVRQGDRVLRLRRAGGRKATPPPAQPKPVAAAASPSAPAARGAAPLPMPQTRGGVTPPAARQPDVSVPGATPVTAGLVGIFHNLPTAAAEGAVVAEREALGQIESMRIMNDCLAPRAGRLVRVRVEDGQPVMYGQILFEIADVDADAEPTSDVGEGNAG